MTYQKEFPDFPPDDMPALPEGFEDTSWHQDICPSYSDGMTLIYIDYRDFALREFEGTYPRFNVQPMRDGIEVTGDGGLQTDDWEEVLAYIENARIARMMQAGGYYILTDLDEPRQTCFHCMQGNTRIGIAYTRADAVALIERHAAAAP